MKSNAQTCWLAYGALCRLIQIRFTQRGSVERTEIIIIRRRAQIFARPGFKLEGPQIIIHDAEASLLSYIVFLGLFKK